MQQFLIYENIYVSKIREILKLFEKPEDFR